MKVRGLLLTTLLLLTAGVLSANTNVALNAPVTANGTFLSGPQTYVCNGTPAAASTVDDDSFYQEQTCWNDGIAWTGTAPYIDIDLQGTFDISSAIVQADDNDTYELQYLGTDSLYHNWWNIGAPGPFGLVTRPNPDQVTQQSLPTVTALGLRIFATGGDDHYALSEVQVFGTPLGAPEPSSLLLLGGALPAISLLRRYRK